MNSSPNLALAKKLNIAAIFISVVVLTLVAVMRTDTKLEIGIDTSILPPINALLNTLVTICLALAFYFIKRKNVKAHTRSVYTAMILSILFLVVYVLYHFTTPETTYCKEGAIRYVYFFILITHIVLAGGIFPFILFTFIRGFTGQVQKHRKMAKWVFPLWFYVAISGPIVYLMLKPCYA